MHYHPEDALFFDHRSSPRSAARPIALTLVVLTVNAGAGSTHLSILFGGIGAILLLLARARGQSTLPSVFLWAFALVVLAVLGPVFLDLNGLHQTGARVLAGIVWILWLGTQVDWTSLKSLLLNFRVPSPVVASIDHAIMQGILTKREWVQRLDAAQLRLGSTHVPLFAWGPLLGEGAFHAFERLEAAQESALLRSTTGETNESQKAERVHLRGVHIERSGKTVLEQVEFTINPGEWLLVCGPSGAGKSSLLRLLAGLDAPSVGSMVRFGNHVLPTSALRARLDGRVALLGQNPEHHFIASTVAEDIAWGLLQRGVQGAHLRAREMATCLGIDALLERPCHQLSFGEQRRAALAGLLVLEPSLLLLDEPTAGLDPVAAHQLRELVEDVVGRTNATCIWATHDLNALPPRAKRVVLLRDRRLLFDGTIGQGLSMPWLVRAGLALDQDRYQTQTKVHKPIHAVDDRDLQEACTERGLDVAPEEK